MSNNAQNQKDDPEKMFRPKSLAGMGPLIYEGFTKTLVKNKTGPGNHNVFRERFSPINRPDIHIYSDFFEDTHDSIRAIKLFNPKANLSFTLDENDKLIVSGVETL